jgi:hypothetical protein
MANDGSQVTSQSHQVEAKEDEQGITVTETETKAGKKVEKRYTVYDDIVVYKDGTTREQTNK